METKGVAASSQYSNQYPNLYPSFEQSAAVTPEQQPIAIGVPQQPPPIVGVLQQPPPPMAMAQPVAPAWLLPGYPSSASFVHMGPGLDTGVRVRLGETVLKYANEKPFREYNFVIEVLGMEHTLCGRYSAFERPMSEWTDDFPKDWFHFAYNYTTNDDNVAQRARELRAFLERALNQHDEGRRLGSAVTHAALQVASSSPMASALYAVAAERKRVADAARSAEAARLAAIATEQRHDCAFAQTFNSMIAYSSVPPGVLTTITFPRPQQFELRNKLGGWGDAVIKGPGGHPWFKLVRTNPSFFGELFKNAHFAITTMSGEVLLVLQEKFRCMNFEYDLFRIDPRTRMHVPVCKIVRSCVDNFLRINDKYRIEHYNQVGLHGTVTCSGSWPNQFTLLAGGAVVASVNKQLVSLTDTYHVQIAAHTDVLLFVGIACAIDRIHHEVEDERGRQESRRRR